MMYAFRPITIYAVQFDCNSPHIIIAIDSCTHLIGNIRRQRLTFSTRCVKSYYLVYIIRLCAYIHIR